jgi:hypothetical protein
VVDHEDQVLGQRGCISYHTSRSFADLSDKYFVLLGAGSAMGPLLLLLSLGANVVAVDLDRPNIWKRLLGLVRFVRGVLLDSRGA